MRNMRMGLEDIIGVLDRAGFKNDTQTTYPKGISVEATRMGLKKTVHGKDFYYWFGPNTDGYFSMTKQATNFVSIRADGNTQIEVLLSGEFPNEYKEYKRNCKLNDLGI